MRFNGLSAMWCGFLMTGLLVAGGVHPKGPEDRPETTRVFQIVGSHSILHLTMTFPELRPDGSLDEEWVLDRTIRDRFNAWEPGIFPHVFTARFPYVGRFWQGVFGSVGFSIRIWRKDERCKEWSTLQSLHEYRVQETLEGNQKQMLNNPSERYLRSNPEISTLNGFSYVYQTQNAGSHLKDTQYMYFLFESDCHVELELNLVDNSNRPGLTKSDWRPRAEAVMTDILRSVKVRVEPM